MDALNSDINRYELYTDEGDCIEENIAALLQQILGHGNACRWDLRLHKLVFQDDVLPDGTELGYYPQGKKLLSGFKKGSGICCDCCNSVVSPSQFESHAGCASRRKPYLQIYTSNGMSLHEISVKISKESGLSTDENDDLCSVCQGDGDLLCCDGCPRAFHLHCVSLPSVPEDKWYCKLCDENIQMEKFAEQNPNAIAAGRIPGIDPMEQITNRCIRIVTLLDTQDNGCALCRIQDFCTSGFGPRTVIICDQELPVGDWFCSSGCRRINSALKKLLEKGDQMLPDDLVHVLKKKLADEQSIGDDPDIRWRVLNGRKCPAEEMLPLLSKAVSVFHDYIHRVVRTAHAGRSGVSISLVNQYEIELFIQIESLIGKKLPKHAAEEEKVLVLPEHVTEAKGIAHMKIKESGGRKRMRRFRNNSRWPLTFAQCTLAWSKEEHLLGKTLGA